MLFCVHKKCQKHWKTHVFMCCLCCLPFFVIYKIQKKNYAFNTAHLKFHPKNHQNYPYFHQFPTKKLVFLQFAHMVHCVQGVVGTCRLFPSNLMWLFLINILSKFVSKRAAKNRQKNTCFYIFWPILRCFLLCFLMIFNVFFYCGPVPAFHGPGKNLKFFFFP